MSKEKEELFKRFSLSNILSDRYAKYAKYIIQERALPDVRDGLKPVQRRILYAMHDLNLSYKSAHKKSARIVGEVIGKYHPHGDSSVYEAMVRMSQEWKTNSPLIDMQGNNGSIDGDSAAAMRYTEVKLSKVSSYLLKDLNNEIVKFVNNFDDSEQEPYILPAVFPNLLVNGANGIAAGYATNIPPHNLSEIIEALFYRIDNPNCNINEILNIVKGPDFPTKGIIYGIDGITNAYKTGKGKILISSKIEIEENRIIISEIPFEISKKVLIQKIDLIRINSENNINIKKVQDLSDKNGIKILIEVNKIDEIEYVKEFLLKKTNLQSIYNINLIAIVDKKPKLCNILNLLDAYIFHRVNIIIKKTKMELLRLNRRLEILKGLIKAISMLDNVIKTIRISTNKISAQNNLISTFKFTKLQAEAIVLLRLYRLTSTDIVELNDELKLNNEKQLELSKLLRNNKLINIYIKNELQELDEQFGIPRQSIVKNKIKKIDIEKKGNIVIEKEVFFTITKKGYIRLIINNDRINKNNMIKKQQDIIISRIITSNKNKLGLITNKGNFLLFSINELPIIKLNSSFGVHISKYYQISPNEYIISSFIFSDIISSKKEIAIFTKHGMAKKIAINNLISKKKRKPIIVIKLKFNDELISSFLIDNNKTKIITTTKNGKSTNYNLDEILSCSLGNSGIKWMKLKAKDEVVSVEQTYKDKNFNLFLITNNNKYKRFNINELKSTKRPAVGINLGIIKNDHIINGFLIDNNSKILCIKNDKLIEIVDLTKFTIHKLNATYKNIPIGKIKKWVREKYYEDIIENE